MKKFLIFGLPIILAVLAFCIFLIVMNAQSNGSGALQVTSIPKSSVYLNGRLIGTTPLCKCDGKNMLAIGDYTIRLVPVDTSLSGDVFEQKITISKAVLTVVDRTFGPGATANGSVITLTPLTDPKQAHLSVVSFPSGVDVSVDESPKSKTPYALSMITESDHDLTLSKIGYKDKNIRIHTVNGYLLSVVAFLGVDPSALNSSPSAQLASPSVAPGKQMIVISETPTGFLRVHQEASITSAEIAQVKPGQEFVLEQENGKWYQIKLPDGKLGWVSSDYAEKK